MKKPVAIGKTTIIVNQGKKFVVKARYTRTRQNRARKIEYILLIFFFIFRVRVFVGNQ
jgi:hypothetical protein